ncbi:MAG: SDR family oxidoreductase [Thermomicrobiales bacterium]
MENDIFDVRGLHIVITGGASGIGLAAARELAGRGAVLDIWDLNPDAMATALSGPLQPFRAQITMRPIDVSDAEAVEAAAAEAWQGAPVDVLINSAGMTSHRRPVLEIPLSDWDRMLGVNLYGTLHTCRAFGRRMIERGTGSIINVSSVDAVDPSWGNLHYGVSKAGVAMLTTGLAREWGTTGVRVNAVGPGPIRTPLTEPLFAAHDWLEPKWVESVPLGRIGEPEDLAGIFVYLASPASRWVTGRSFYIDGGWLL